MNDQLLIDTANKQFILDAQRIFAARSDPAAPSPFFNNPVYANLMPEIQEMVDEYQPLGIVVPGGVNLTPRYDISMFDGTPLTSPRRHGANGNSLRALAMAYKPTGLHLTMILSQGMSDAMYSFYGRSYLEINLLYNIRVYLDRFHRDVTSIKLNSSAPNLIASLDPMVDRMMDGPDHSFRFILGSSIVPAPAASTRRTMRRLVMTGLHIMQSSTNPHLKIFLSFRLGNDPQRDDQDTHRYLERLVDQTQGMSYSLVDRESRVEKPAQLNIRQRTLRFRYNTVDVDPIPHGCFRVTLSIDTY